MTRGSDMTPRSAYFSFIEVTYQLTVVELTVPSVNLGNLSLKVGKITLRKTPHDIKAFQPSFSLSMSQLKYGVDTLLLGITDETTCVNDGDVTLKTVAIMCTLITGSLEHTNQILSVNEIL
jgi:hypothetical protein